MRLEEKESKSELRLGRVEGGGGGGNKHTFTFIYSGAAPDATAH